MAGELTALEDWAGALMAKLTPAARRRAAKAIATALRKSQQQRIAQQQNPDGSAYVPRKAQPARGKRGRIKRKAAMFAKLRTAKYLKARSTPNEASVAFVGRAAAIARVHQEGATDHVNKRILARYPRRVLLGFSAADRELVRDVLLAQLAD